MAEGLRVEFAKSAEDDLLDIVAWYTSQHAPEVGKRLVGAVLERVGQLALFPDSGRVVPEFDTPWLRELEMPPYRIVYRRDDAVVTVVRVRQRTADGPGSGGKRLTSRCRPTPLHGAAERQKKMAGPWSVPPCGPLGGPPPPTIHVI